MECGKTIQHFVCILLLGNIRMRMPLLAFQLFFKSSMLFKFVTSSTTLDLHIMTISAL